MTWQLVEGSQKERINRGEVTLPYLVRTGWLEICPKIEGGACIILAVYKATMISITLLITFISTYSLYFLCSLLSKLACSLTQVR